MANLCGECLKLDWNNKSSYGSKYFCKELSKYVEPGEHGCSYYSYNQGNNNKNSNGWKPSGFSWSVILGKLGESLGLTNDSVFIESMQFFKNNVLENDELFEYCKRIIDNLFVPMFEFIKLENIKDAKLTFQNFVEDLQVTFGLSLKEDKTKELTQDRVLKRVNIKPSEA